MGAAQAVYTPLAASFTLIDSSKIHFELETDFNIGYQAYHVGHPSDYSELVEEVRTSINAKNWLKFNLNVLDTYVESLIFEFTWFEVQPLDAHIFWQEPENVLELVKMISTDDFDAHISLNYFLDAMSLKVFRIKYPTFCTVELSALI